MSLLTLSNPDTASVWNVVLDKHPEVENDLPLTFFNIKNGSSLTLIVYLNGSRAGIVEAYSMDTYIGKQFETFTVITKDGDNLAIDDVFVQVGNNIQMTTSPYNPTWDMMEENVDVYASGCDSRLSLSATWTVLLMKYWINVQNSNIVQRRLSIQGSAALGTYAITYNLDTIVSGGCPINGEILETKLYKKKIENSEFDYSLTNCTIKGWMIDYLKNPNDISDDYTVVTGAAPTNAIDDDLSTYIRYSRWQNTWGTVLELSFTSRHISSISSYYNCHAASATGNMKFQIEVASIWTDVISTGEGVKYEHANGDWDNVTGVRLQLHNSNSGSSYWTHCDIYDLSMFE